MTTPIDCKILLTVTSERQWLQSPVALGLLNFIMRKVLQTARPLLCLWLDIKIAPVKFLFGWIQEITQGYSTAQNFKAVHNILNIIY
jgi:hypothetical protein